MTLHGVERAVVLLKGGSAYTLIFSQPSATLVSQSRTATGGASQEADLPQVIWHASPAGNSAAQAEEGTPSENRSPNLAMSHSSIKRRLIQASGRPTQALDPSRKR